MKRLFWDRKENQLLLRDNPSWCNIVINENNIMTIDYEDSFKKKILTKQFKKVTTAMNVARSVYDKLSCHRRGGNELFDVDLPGESWKVE